MGTSFKGKVISVIVLWILGIFGASTAIVSKAWLWERVFWVLSLATSIISFINIFFSLRRNQIHAQNSVSQEQASRIIPLYHVCSAFWVQLTGCLLSAFDHSQAMTPQRGRVPTLLYLARNLLLL